MSDDLNYSIDAENILSQFAETDYVVFVEDEDDEFFWKKIFCLFAKEKSFTFRYESDTKGCAVLDNKIEKLVRGELDSSIVIARDSDYLIYKGKKVVHKNVLYTFGHSIENCLFSDKNILTIFSNLSRSDDGANADLVNDWLGVMTNGLQKLIKLDIVVQKKGYGIGILGKSCDEFTTKNCDINHARIDVKFNDIKNMYPNIENDINSIGYIPTYDIKGHFFMSLVSKFLRCNCKPKISLPLDNLMTFGFATLTDAILADSERKDYYLRVCNNLH